MFGHRKKELFLSVYVDDITITGKKQNVAPMWKMMKKVDIDEPTSFLYHENLRCTLREYRANESATLKRNVRITYFCRSN